MSDYAALPEQLSAGANLHVLRLCAEISQSALARELAARGVRFTQQAVDRVERGIRSLRVEEAVIVADVLGIQVSDLLATNPDRIAALMQLLRGRANERRLAPRVEQLAAELDEAQQQLAEARAMRQRAEIALDHLADDAPGIPQPALAFTSQVA
jgi:transcriptional regulator with XRE-family HTH domain